MSGALPDRVLAWYGDDFTGSTDVLEVLATRGVASVLFLEQPDDAFLSRFADCRAFGLAGSSRSESPEWMDRNLPPVFKWLRGLGASICHYKVCSTFDSSPETGSIGRALELGQDVFGSTCVPVVVGAPALRRYMVFGNLFAGVDGQTYRIDRHPTMSRHPVTPMHESDLRLHLAKQTRRRIRLVDVLDLQAPDVDSRVASKLAAKPEVLFFDILDEQSLKQVGRLLWPAADRPRFVVGSSGVEYALTAHWLEDHQLEAPAPCSWIVPTDRVVVLSGSCSPVTAQQVLHAGRNGFALVRLDARALVRGEGIDPAMRCALVALEEGRSVVLYTAAGPHDEAALDSGRHLLSEQAGRILCAVLDRSGVRRAVVAGGDTSSHAGRQLGIQALTFVCPVAPGAPLCRAWSRNAGRDGLEIVFKGGQCGQEDFFSRVLGQLQ